MGNFQGFETTHNWIVLSRIEFSRTFFSSPFAEFCPQLADKSFKTQLRMTIEIGMQEYLSETFWK